MVLSGGVSIYPAEIEAALAAHPDIEDTAVFGVPDPEFGESVVAYVQAAPAAGLTSEAVRAHVRGRLAGFKVPKHVVIKAKLPREETGKIKKRNLRAEFLERVMAHG
jgi:long-chain acyl-CoA synthetase